MKIKKKHKFIACCAVAMTLVAYTLHTCTADEPVKEPQHQAPIVTPEARASMARIAHRTDSIMHSYLRLDTNQIAVSIYDLEARQPVYRYHAAQLMTPASILKLFTALTAMEYLGVNHQWLTEVRLQGQQSGSTFRGNVVLHLDDDPLCQTLQPLAEAIRKRGITTIEGNVVFDLLRSDTLRPHKTVAAWNIPYYKLPILLKGRPRIEKEFSYLLHSAGVTVHRQPELRASGRPVTIYSHRSSLGEVLTPMLTRSSNIVADEVDYHINHVRGGGTRGGLTREQKLHRLMNRVFTPRGIDWHRFVINDGSGLSPQNRITPDALVAVLEYVWHRPAMRDIFVEKALATPGNAERRGSLTTRMSNELFRGKVFLKTGTLVSIGLSSLAGYAQGIDGRWYAFAIVNENSPVGESHLFQDRLCREIIR